MSTTETRPLIGVTGPDQGGGPAWYCTRFQLWLAGARAVRITPSRPRALRGLHGLIIGGGADVHPSRYNEAITQTIRSESRRLGRGRYLQFIMNVGVWLARRLFSIPLNSSGKDVARDNLEFVLLKEAVSWEMPVLGICRGGQLINVHFGGTLYQDLSTFYVEKPNLRTLRPRKLVHVEGGTTLYRLVQQPNILVNSLHNQSVKIPGHGLRVSAREMNGVIQAIEHSRLPFMVGVQWHPEFLPLVSHQRHIFHSLVEAARVFQLRHTQGSLPPDLEILNLAKS